MDSQPGPSRSPGLLASLRKLGSTLVELVQARFELIAAEIEEERARIIRLLILSAVAMFFLSLGIITLTFLIIVLAWDTHRVLAMSIITALYLGAGILVAIRARAVAREATRVFSASLDQLRKDRDALSS